MTHHWENGQINIPKKEVIQLVGVLLTALDAYGALHDLLSDLIERGHLQAGDISLEDSKAITSSLVACVGPNQRARDAAVGNGLDNDPARRILWMLAEADKYGEAGGPTAPGDAEQFCNRLIDIAREAIGFQPSR